jgi:hypothetical protein
VGTDWKTRLMETRRTGSPQAWQQVLQSTLATGAASPAEVKTFLHQHKDLFGDDAHVVAQKAAEALLDSSSSKLPASALAGAAGSVKAHQVRFTAPPASLAWHQRAELPAPMASRLPAGTGADVVVDGERFSAADVATLLSLAA